MIPLNPKEGLAEFFRGIWGVHKGLVYLPVKEADGLTWTKPFYHWPNAAETIVDHCLANSARGADVFFSPVIWANPALEKKAILGSQVLYADFDGNAPDIDQWARPGDASVPGPPTVVVQSSGEGNQHVYWKLDELITDTSVLEAANRAIAYTYGADTSGWDAEQILRPPFTTNYKHKYDPQTKKAHCRENPPQVTVRTFDSNRYSIKEFQHFKPVISLIKEEVDENALPDPISVIARYTWDCETSDLLGKDIPEGSRSSALMRVAYKCCELGLTDSEAYAVIRFVDDRLGKFVGRRDRHKRLLDTLNHARQKHPQATEELTFSGLYSNADSSETEGAQYVYGFKDFLKSEFKTEWLVEGLIPLQGIGMIASAPGAGKTQLMLRLAMYSALGRKFLQYTPNGEHKGMFLSLEMTGDGLSFFTTAVSKELSEEDLDKLQENLLIVPLGDAIPLNGRDEGKKFVENLIETHKIKVLYIDSLQKIFTGKLNDDDSVRELFRYLAKLKSKYGIAIWVIHHNRKAQVGNTKPIKLEDIIGSVYLTTDCDVVLTVWKSDENSSNVELHEAKNKYKQLAQPQKLTRTNTLDFIPRVDKGAPVADNTALEGFVARAETTMGLEGDNPFK